MAFDPPCGAAALAPLANEAQPAGPLILRGPAPSRANPDTVVPLTPMHDAPHPLANALAELTPLRAHCPCTLLPHIADSLLSFCVRAVCFGNAARALISESAVDGRELELINSSRSP